jgi:hypothetical protein
VDDFGEEAGEAGEAVAFDDIASSEVKQDDDIASREVKDDEDEG